MNGIYGLRGKFRQDIDAVAIIESRGRLPPVNDYRSYRFTRREFILNIIAVAICMLAVSYVFYDSLYAWIFFMPFCMGFLKSRAGVLCIRRKRELEKEFRDMILSVSNNMQAGYSIENAFIEAYKDISLLYGKGSLMAEELNLLIRRLGNNELLEDILTNLAYRSGIKDIRDFADIFHIAKRSGGNVREIIHNSACIISDKQEVRREIDTIMTEKKMELKIMKGIPFFMIFYISITSKGYFSPLYHNIAGWIIMSAALAVYAVACTIADKIMDIEV